MQPYQTVTFQGQVGVQEYDGNILGVVGDVLDAANSFEAEKTRFFGPKAEKTFMKSQKGFSAFGPKNRVFQASKLFTASGTSLTTPKMFPSYSPTSN